MNNINVGVGLDQPANINTKMHKTNVGVGAHFVGNDLESLANQRGITLIALIITIIVLLILAGVSISLLTGTDSIIGKARQGKVDYEAASQNEADTINGLIDMIDESMLPLGPGDAGYVVSTANGIQQVEDGDGETVLVPVGFSYLTGTKATGFVIENENDHNEFVWIPCDLALNNPQEGTLIYQTYEWSKGYAATAYTEYYSSTATDNANIISRINTSIGTYKGYYISRYEAGTEVQRTSSGEATQTVVSKPTSAGTPVYAYNYVNWDQAIEKAGSLYIKDTENADENQRVYVQSRLINARGCDTALKFIEQVDNVYPTDSTNKGWYSGVSGNNNYEIGKSVDTTNTTTPNMLKKHL